MYTRKELNGMFTEGQLVIYGWKGNIEIPAKCGITAANLLCI